jgi:hypothetical protein
VSEREVVRGVRSPAATNKAAPLAVRGALRELCATRKPP